MNETRAMSEIDQYDYKLPPELIAQDPLATRSDSRLMVVDRATDSLEHRFVRDLPSILKKGDCLVINDTKVIPARLIGKRVKTGGKWEGLFLSVTEDGFWRILCKTRGKQEPGEPIELINRRAKEDIKLRLIERQEGGAWLVYPEIETEETVWDTLARVGRVPLPHYIRGGEMTEDDRTRYQTIYAREPGSAAAPTAGLHFTEELMRKLIDRGVTPVRVTLHVGLDTFRPIKVETLDEHVMHTEWCHVDEAAAERINALRAAGGRCVAVGTTAARTLETASRSGRVEPWDGPTDIFIRPGFQINAVDALMTNFHLPRSTLLVLVRTFGGDALMRRAYEEAIAEKYRFYSYGDAMLIL